MKSNAIDPHLKTAKRIHNFLLRTHNGHTDRQLQKLLGADDLYTIRRRTSDLYRDGKLMVVDYIEENGHPNRVWRAVV